MSARPRVVLDTNVIISRLLAPRGAAAQAVRIATSTCAILASDETLMELADVIARPRFDPYLSIAERQAFVRLVGQIAEHVSVSRPVIACRDPRDDKFLSLAVNGSADIVVTGDADLLVLDPFGTVRIVTPAGFIERHGP